MKKLFNILLFVLPVILIGVLSSCNNDNPNNDQNIEPKTNLYYRVDGHSDVIYTINSRLMSSSEYVMVSSLQGIVAQNSSSIFIIEDNDDEKWLNECAVTYDLRTVAVTNAWDLVDLFSYYLNENKFVLYNLIGEENTSYSDQSINYAATVAGIEKYLMISKALKDQALAHGLVLGIDVTEDKWNTKYVFDTYKDKLNKGYLIHQKPSQFELRDYAIAGKAICFYSDYYDGSDNIREEISNWANKNAPILGWTENEVNYVSANSLLSKITIAADWANNLSFYSSLEREDEIKQTNHKMEELRAEKGKHYVAIVMSDGDNVQWMTNSFATSNLYYNSPYCGEFKMTWTMAPSLYDLAPNILTSLYNKASKNDYFMAGPSGAGYVNASEYNERSISEYAAYTAGYMEKMDTSCINFIDSFIDKNAYKYFASYDNVKGGILSVGNYYLEGNGSLYWVNDKPFVSVRESLWRSEGNDAHNKYYGYVERVAQRINGYSKDPTKIEGYSVVLAHAWSIGSMEYIARFVDSLDDDVVLVTADELINLISKNVKHEDVTELDDISPSDLDNNLVPISTEQYRLSDLDKIEVSNARKFMFESEDEKTWNFKCGGLQYDFAGFKDGKVTLDGSDLDDRIDAFPNSWMYAKFTLGENDKNLQIKVNCGENADTNYRVRVLYKENEELKSTILNSDGYNEVNEFGYYLLNQASPSTFNYDLTPFVGKTVVISIEQDDSGEGSGEIVNVNKILISSSTELISEKVSWAIDEIMDEWSGIGKVVMHTEGVCLENYGSEAKISCKVLITSDKTTFKFSARKFARVGSSQDKDAKILVKVNGQIINPKYAESEYVSICLNDFRSFAYDFSAYSGQVVTIEIVNIEGEHACFNRIYFE